jgi:hypothetical protein
MTARISVREKGVREREEKEKKKKQAIQAQEALSEF